ncbi:MAG: histidine kinase [Acidobacteriota bacterium]
MSTTPQLVIATGSSPAELGAPLSRRRSPPRYALELLLAGAFGGGVGALVGVIGSVLDVGTLEGPLVAIGAVSGMAAAITSLVAGREILPRFVTYGTFPRVVLVVLTLTGAAIASTLLGFWLYPIFSLHAGRSVLLVGAMNGVLTLVAGTLVYLYEDMAQRLARTQQMLAAERVAQVQARERATRAELLALQARINPHFFFNALNTAMALVAEDPSRAEQLLERFAGLFRYAFRRGGESLVPLEVEMNFIRDYLEIEKARFGERLSCGVWLDDAVRNELIPPLILQPLVENAVLHGRDPQTGQGRVDVNARRSATGGVELEVLDQGPGPGPAAEQWPAGHALENVAARIAAARGGRLEIAPAEGRGTRARVIVPPATADATRTQR